MHDRMISFKQEKKIAYTQSQSCCLPVEEWLASFGLGPNIIVEMQVVPISMSWVNLHDRRWISEFSKYEWIFWRSQAVEFL
jgi:hypothetical protein